eukprot:777213-Rhodomonas_salina.9
MRVPCQYWPRSVGCYAPTRALRDVRRMTLQWGLWLRYHTRSQYCTLLSTAHCIAAYAASVLHIA